MNTKTLCTATLVLTLGAVAFTSVAFAAAKITPDQAKAAAVKKIPGRATAAKYEFEDGHWQYAVTVVSKSGQMYEAEVSSTTGKVTATEKTSAAEEATEAAADKKAAEKKATGMKASTMKAGTPPY